MSAWIDDKWAEAADRELRDSWRRQWDEIVKAKYPWLKERPKIPRTDLPIG